MKKKVLLAVLLLVSAIGLLFASDFTEQEKGDVKVGLQGGYAYKYRKNSVDETSETYSTSGLYVAATLRYAFGPVLASKTEVGVSFMGTTKKTTNTEGVSNSEEISSGEPVEFNFYEGLVLLSKTEKTIADLTYGLGVGIDALAEMPSSLDKLNASVGIGAELDCYFNSSITFIFGMKVGYYFININGNNGIVLNEKASDNITSIKAFFELSFDL